MSLKVENLLVSREGKPIVGGASFELKKGEVVALMGPNGSGKSTLANAVMGHPKYEVAGGRIVLDGEDVTRLSPDKRAKAGLFLSMQAPPEIPGVTLASFLRTSYNSLKGRKLGPLEFQAFLAEKMSALKMDSAFARRHLNAGFSGGEKKRAEILQLTVLEPGYALLDETDSGLDVDALKTVADGINRLRGPGIGILLITHYTRLLKLVEPDRVIVMRAGRLVAEGGKELAEKIDREGFDSLTV